MANTHLVSAWVPGNWVLETTGISWIRETWVKEESEKASLKLNIQKTKIMASGPTISWQTDGKKSGNSDRFLFSWAPNSLWMVNAATKLKDVCFLEETLMTNLGSTLKSKDITLPTKVHSQNYGFSSTHVRMSELGHKKGWVSKNWCFWTMVLEKTLELGLKFELLGL